MTIRALGSLYWCCSLLLLLHVAAGKDAVIGVGTWQQESSSDGPSPEQQHSLTQEERAWVQAARAKLYAESQGLQPVLDHTGALTPHQFLFMHVMKTSGLALDQVIQKQCTQRLSAQLKCSLQRKDGIHSIQPAAVGKEMGWNASGPCTSGTPILTIHGHLSEVQSNCPAFEKAIKVTIVREPVERVISLYKYCGRKKGSWPRTKSFPDILKLVHQGVSDEMCPYCSWEWHNQMVKVFSTLPPPEGGWNRWPLFEKVDAAFWERHLESAKKNLIEEFHVIGLTHDPSEFMARLRDRVPWLFRGAGSLPKYNVTHTKHFPHWDHLNDEKVTHRLAQMNTYDLELYKFALAAVEEDERLRAIHHNPR